MLTKEESAVFLNVLALLALHWSAAELPGVQKVLMTQSPDGPSLLHPGSGRSCSAWQEGKFLFWDLRDLESHPVPQDMSAHSAGTVVLWRTYLFGMFSSHSQV